MQREPFKLTVTSNGVTAIPHVCGTLAGSASASYLRKTMTGRLTVLGRATILAGPLWKPESSSKEAQSCALSVPFPSLTATREVETLYSTRSIPSSEDTSNPPGTSNGHMAIQLVLRLRHAGAKYPSKTFLARRLCPSRPMILTGKSLQLDQSS